MNVSLLPVQGCLNKLATNPVGSSWLVDSDRFCGIQQMEGLTYATALYLNMGYYMLRLDPSAQRICTIILPWGKYLYLRLPMGVAGSPDIFQEQEKMSCLMETLDYRRTYLDDLFIIFKSSFDDHLIQIDAVLSCVRDAGLYVNAAKSSFAESEIE